MWGFIALLGVSVGLLVWLLYLDGKDQDDYDRRHRLGKYKEKA